MINKLLVICGPTATGKTDLALKISKTIQAELISADSRQVYKYLDIGTGKDIKKSSKFNFVDRLCGGYYQMNGTRLWGYDLADPHEGFSVSKYSESVRCILSSIKGLPILVGGTGLYIKSIVDGIDSLGVPPDEEIRAAMKGKAASELFEILAPLDPVKAGELNSSDRKNPRRLIRAIELSHYKKDKSLSSSKIEFSSTLIIGLTYLREKMIENIVSRVERRVESGIVDEIAGLLRQGVGWDSQAMNSIGYKEWKPFFQGYGSKSNALNLWIKNEIQYAKRQITWFKKDPRIKWFDIEKEQFAEKIEELVKKWYKK